jgi:uncharacterized protein (TIGR00375 family)
MLENADFHIHSPFSMATSRNMTPQALLEACRWKGISILGCGDALHPQWRAMWADFLDNDAGVLVIPTLEVEGENRVHHLIFMEDFDACAALAGRLEEYSRTLGTMGRPFVSLAGERIAREVHDLGGMIGPAHAFTPWTGLYGHFDSVGECYGDEPIDFLELGLSADSSYGAGISELSDVVFLSNSDAHSANPLKIGREFNRITLQRRSVRGVFEGIRRHRIVMNAGFFPEQGKYNRTACTRCHHQYTADEAREHDWRCPADGGLIKMGVWDRARELNDGPARARPPYYHILPLGEIIRVCLGMSSPSTKKCRMLYESLILALGPEIEVLTDVPIPAISAIHEGVGEAVAAFRNSDIILHPGGGGRYGSFSFQSVSGACPGIPGMKKC